MARRCIFGGLLIATMVLLVAPPVSGRGFERAAGEPFPKDWFFPDRPATLTAMEGKPAPEPKLGAWIGDKVDFSQTRGKVVVIDFWATWCGPCMAAIPHNIEMVKKYKDQGLVFVGVHDANSGWDRADAVVKEKGINYPVVKDDGGASAKAFNIAFWPTYIVIDKAGVVRGIGMLPGKVEEAVAKLLAEDGPAGAGSSNAAAGAASGFPVEWFYGDRTRPAWLRQTEGKPASAVTGTHWVGDEPEPGELKDKVVIVHFFSLGNGPAAAQAEQLAALEREMGPQGVVVIGVCPSDEPWEPVVAMAKEGRLMSRIARDVPLGGPVGGEGPAETGKEAEPTPSPATPAPKPATKPKDADKPVSTGATALGFAARFAPTTVVIDRAGVVRAAGVKIEQVKMVAGKLLAESSRKPAGIVQ